MQKLATSSMTPMYFAIKWPLNWYPVVTSCSLILLKSYRRIVYSLLLGLFVYICTCACTCTCICACVHVLAI